MTFNLAEARALHDRNPEDPEHCATCTKNATNYEPWPCPTATALGATGRSEWLDPTDDNHTNRVHIDKTGWYYIGPGLDLKPDTTTVTNFDTHPECGTQTRAPGIGVIICGRPPHHPGNHLGATPRGDNWQWDDTPEPATCGAVAGGFTRYPCLLAPGHNGDHQDSDGDTWTPEDEPPTTCTSTSPGGRPCTRPADHLHTFDVLHRNGHHRWPEHRCTEETPDSKKRCRFTPDHSGTCNTTSIDDDPNLCTFKRENIPCALDTMHTGAHRSFSGTVLYDAAPKPHTAPKCTTVTDGIRCILNRNHTWEHITEETGPTYCTSIGCIRNEGHNSLHIDADGARWGTCGSSHDTHGDSASRPRESRRGPESD